MEQTYEEKVRAQYRARSKKYYDANKQKILDKKMADRAELKRLRREVAPPAPEPVPAPRGPPDNYRVHRLDGTIERVKRVRITHEDVLEKLISIGNKRQTDQFKELTRILGEKNSFKTQLTNFDNTKRKIDRATYKTKPDVKLTDGVKLKLVNCICFCIDNVPIKVDKQPFADWSHELQQETLETAQKKITSEEHAVLPWDEYMRRVREKFAVDSKQWLVISLYNRITMRDDLGGLKIVNSIIKNDNSETNYLITPRSGNYKIIIQAYKTNKKYGVITFDLSAELTELIRNYMEKHHLELGDALFPEKSMSRFVGSINKAIGITGGINVIRHSKITKELENFDTMSATEKVRLAKLSFHSPFLHRLYERRLDKL